MRRVIWIGGAHDGAESDEAWTSCAGSLLLCCELARELLARTLLILLTSLVC